MVGGTHLPSIYFARYTVFVMSLQIVYTYKTMQLPDYEYVSLVRMCSECTLATAVVTIIQLAIDYFDVK